jgi:hypothetical protein
MFQVNSETVPQLLETHLLPFAAITLTAKYRLMEKILLASKQMDVRYLGVMVEQVLWVMVLRLQDVSPERYAAIMPIVA